MSESEDVAMPLPSFSSALVNGFSNSGTGSGHHFRRDADAPSHSQRSSPARGARRSIPRRAFGTPSAKPRRTFSASTGDEIEVWPATRDVRECNDVVHGDICIPPAVQVMLDSPPVQRLSNLKQLGCASNAYPCCTHTRKEHSLGAMELAGSLATNLRRKQPNLEISDRDVLCLRIAGLCHDLGHGPFSHTYEAFLRASYENERDNPEQYEERNKRFEEEFGVEIPPLPERYEHEPTSLMMIDFALATVGLEIDWENLDKPLRQVGVGIDANEFGAVHGSGDARTYDPLTSRDFAFIKECVYGAPLERPHAPWDQTSFVGRDKNKEFLYDIVNNRHNGLDVDKVDYFIRDSLAAFASKLGDLNVFLRDAFVAWGAYPDTESHFERDETDEADERRHLMICYPSKHTSAAMNFFATRMKNHESIYTHKKTKASELQMVDLLLEADKHFCMLLPTQSDDPDGFDIPSRFDDFEFRRLPISRAWMYPRLFLRVDDTIVSIIESKTIENRSSELGRLRELLSNRRNHRFYKCVAEEEVGTLGGEDLWEMSEDKIKEELLGENGRHDNDGALWNLEAEDFIVEKRSLHYGRKEKNPVSQMRFLKSKEDQAKLSNPIEELPTAVEIKNLPTNLPSSFLRRTVRFFCRSQKKEKYDLLKHAIHSWQEHRKQRSENPTCAFELISGHVEDEDDSSLIDDSQPVTQDDDCESPLLLPPKRKYSDDEIRKPAKKRLAYN